MTTKHGLFGYYIKAVILLSVATPAFTILCRNKYKKTSTCVNFDLDLQVDQ